MFHASLEHQAQSLASAPRVLYSARLASDFDAKPSELQESW